MRKWKTWLACGLVLASGGFAALSLLRGQEHSSAVPAPLKGALPAVIPAKAEVQTPASSPAPRSHVGAWDPRDLSKLSDLQKQMYLSAQRGGDWLRRVNGTDGRFLHGWLPDLKAPLEGDHYLRQVGAAFALSRVARFLGDERYTAIARQAVLTLLADTETDAEDPQLRHTSMPSIVVNRLASAGLLVMAINELPSPGEDLQEQSEQLCAFIRKQQGPDGSLSFADPQAQAVVDPEGINSYPGEALYGLMLSQRHRPAPWKTEVVRKALPFYQSWWREHKSMALIPWQTAVYSEAYLLTKQKPFADFVTEMNDWLCGLQYVQLDPRHPLWNGGFMEWIDGQPRTSAPQVSCAAYAESLAEACRAARQLGDVPRHQRYREALERCLQFLVTLQYTDANTQHFADWYRPRLLGAFHSSHQDGNLRIDYTQHAVCALVGYLTHVGKE